MLPGAQSDTGPTADDYEEEIVRLRKLAFEDELTKLGNRRAFEHQLRKSLAQSKRYGGALSLALADVDWFKTVNDDHGHPVGDEVLRRIGEALCSSVREADHAARIGGDEFAIILPNTPPTQAEETAERVRQRIANVVLPRSIRVTASFGVATATDPDTAAELYARADTALYQAKRSGKNRVRVAG